MEKMKPLVEALAYLGRNKCILKVREYCLGVPIIGFNTGKYDINVLRKYGFINHIVRISKETEESIFLIKSCTQYKQIRVHLYNFIDQILYCAGGVDLRSFIKGYTGKSQKGVLPYEVITDFEWFEKPVKTLTIKDFDSNLKGVNSLLSLDDKKTVEECFELFKEDCIQRGLWEKTRYDFVKDYAMRDVTPLLEACQNQRQLFYDFKIEMYKDAVTLSSASQLVGNKFSLGCFKSDGFDEYWKSEIDRINGLDYTLKSVPSQNIKFNDKGMTTT